MRVIWEQWWCHFQSEVIRLFEKQVGCDVVFLLGRQRLLAHSFVLSVFSPYFEVINVFVAVYLVYTDVCHIWYTRRFAMLAPCTGTR